MKQFIPIVAAAAIGGAVLLRPVPPPTAAAGGWSSASPEPAGGHGRGGRTPAPQAMVYVAGYVLRPGVYPVRPEARARDALALAGGARSDADLVAVNLAAHVRDGDEIVVPPRGAPAPNAVSGGHGRSRRAGGLCRDGAACRTRGPRRAHRSGVASDSGRDGRPLRSGGRGRRPRGDGAPPAEVDINTADADTLAMVPGIGGGLAKRIVEFREQNGAFASIDELLDVAGITEHRLDAMLPYVIAR